MDLEPSVVRPGRSVPLPSRSHPAPRRASRRRHLRGGARGGLSSIGGPSAPGGPPLGGGAASRAPRRACLRLWGFAVSAPGGLPRTPRVVGCRWVFCGGGCLGGRRCSALCTDGSVFFGKYWRISGPPTCPRRSDAALGRRPRPGRSQRGQPIGASGPEAVRAAVAGHLTPDGRHRSAELDRDGGERLLAASPREIVSRLPAVTTAPAAASSPAAAPHPTAPASSDQRSSRSRRRPAASFQRHPARPRGEELDPYLDRFRLAPHP